MELKGSSTTGRRTLDEEIHVERRRIFWQRIYSEALARMLTDYEADEDTDRYSATAAHAADKAVGYFDRWEASQRAKATENPAPDGDAGGGDEDDPDDQYLGR